MPGSTSSTADHAADAAIEAEMESLCAPLGAFLPAMEEIKAITAKIKTGSATAGDVASLKDAASTAKASKAVLSAATPEALKALKVTATARETKRIVKLMRQSQEVDLCFVIDATGSMAGLISAVKRNIRGIVQQLGKCCPHLKLRLALVGYRDLEDGDDRFAVTDFATSVGAFEGALGALTAGGGADQCEDVLGGLDRATRLGWQQTTRVLMLCADAPCHGTQYHDGCGDNHPGGTGMEARPVLQALQQLGTDCTFMRMNGTTDKMIAQFNVEVAAELFGTSPLDEADLARTTVGIISASMSKSAGAARAKRRVFEPLLDSIIEAKEGSARSAGGSAPSAESRPSSAAAASPASSSATAMALPDWFARLKKDGAGEVMARIGVEEPADLAEVASGEIEEIAAVLPKLKARQFRRFMDSGGAAAA